jgi:hypothetical protein
MGWHCQAQVASDFGRADNYDAGALDSCSQVTKTKQEAS